MTDSNPVDRPRPRGRANGSTDTEPNPEVTEGTWYWDRRSRKAYYARQVGDHVEFVTRWHADEVTDALEAGAVVELDEMPFEDDGHTFDLKDTFRTSLSGPSDGGE